MRIGIQRIRKAGVAAAVAAVTVVGLLPLAGAPASAATTSTRYAGADRYDTAARIATGNFTTADTVIIATGENFPDALAGTYIAGQNTAPILLTAPDTLPTFTSDALTALHTTKVILLGGVQAISQNVENQLKAKNLTVTRLFGATRYDTAQAVNNAPGATTVGSVKGKKAAFLARGERFPDALFAGPGAWANKLPMILTTDA